MERTTAEKPAPIVSSSIDDPATAYALAVCDGEILAGPHVRASCARHLRDLETGEERGLYWDTEAAKNAYEFFEQVLKLNGGEYEGVPFTLLDWQLFILGSLFGWKGDDGYRRFRVAYVETAKGSGKSPLAAGVGLYGLMADKEPRAEVYAAATKKDQAMILFRDAVAMVDHSPDLTRRIRKSGSPGKEWNLAYHAAGSFFRPIASDNSQSGPRPHVALLDEIHEHKDGTVVEMIRAGTKNRRQALIFMITNSGVDRTSVCYDYHDYAEKVSSGMIEDDAFFGYVCSLDREDDPFESEACWPKANPSLLQANIPGWKYIREQVTQARGMPSKESVVRRLNFCEWVEAADPFVGRDVWFACEDKTFDPALLEGRRCFGGLDLSSTKDLTALRLHFEPIDDDPYWRAVGWFWVPGDGIAKRSTEDRVPYVAWRDAGYLEALPGAAVDKRAVAAKLVSICGLYDVVAIAFDRWRIEDLKMILDEMGADLPLEGFGQGYQSMAPAVDEYERRLLNLQIRHDGNPVMTWCAANAVVEQDPAGNRKLSKRKAIGRIDGAVADVMAVGVSLAHADERGAYDERGVVSV